MLIQIIKQNLLPNIILYFVFILKNVNEKKNTIEKFLNELYKYNGWPFQNYPSLT